MNYKKLYNSIITKRQTNKFNGYVERHHILPKSLGGTDDPVNLVDLSAREHFICHLLLTKIYVTQFEHSKMVRAFMMMLTESKNQSRYFSSHRYEKLREEFANLQSILQSGKGNSQYGTRCVHLPTGVFKKIHHSELEYYLNNGWLKGRTEKSIKEPKVREKVLPCKHLTDTEILDAWNSAEIKSLRKVAVALGVNHVSLMNRLKLLGLS